MNHRRKTHSRNVLWTILLAAGALILYGVAAAGVIQRHGGMGALKTWGGFCVLLAIGNWLLVAAVGLSLRQPTPIARLFVHALVWSSIGLLLTGGVLARWAEV